jgi:hypothetical protein
VTVVMDDRPGTCVTGSDKRIHVLPGPERGHS